MLVRVLGASAGGGLPQWNCRCANCQDARDGSPDVRPRTQSSLATSADGKHWFLLNVSPDVRQQIAAFPPLGPPPQTARGTGIAGCILTDAELDHTAGLLLLREGTSLSITCTPLVRRWLEQYLGIQRVLSAFVDLCWTELTFDRPAPLLLADGSESGLVIRTFAVDPHVPKFVRPRDETFSDKSGVSDSTDPPDTPAEQGSVVGLHVEDARTGGRLVYAPCVASLGEPLRQAADGADCLLLDGTFWSDDEPQRVGFTERTARQMGHLPVDGPTGSLPWLSDLPIRERAYVHINNTNPMLRRGSPQQQQVASHGIRIASDGDLFEL